MRKLDNFVNFDPMFSTISNSEEITPNEKILLSKIITFYINEKKCTAGNGWFATRLTVKKCSISVMINSLLRKGFIECTYYFDNDSQTKKRWIKITQKTINLITKDTLKEVTPAKEFSSFNAEEPQPTGYKYDINSLIKKMEKEAMSGEYGFFGNDNEEIASEIDF